MLKEFRRMIKINQWKKSLDIDNHHQSFQKIFIDGNGFSMSRQCRLKADAMEYIYSEINFISFIALFSLVHPNDNMAFYDLGSGLGQTAIALSMVFNLKSATGIELFANLHFLACNHRDRLAQIPYYAKKMQKVQFINQNFLNTDLKNATHIFINATGFFGPTWVNLIQRIDQLYPGIIIITTTKAISSKKFKILHQTQLKTSFGIITAFIQEKII